MVLEFYVEGPTAPKDFDVFLHADGRQEYREKIKRTKDAMRVVVELRHRKVSAYLAHSMFRLIIEHQTVTVAFYGFPE